MRTMRLILGFCLSFVFASPSSALENAPRDTDSLLVLHVIERPAPVVRRPGRTIASFAIDERAFTLTAFGRRARARAMGNAEDVWRARAMGKVFDGAPQPALVTVELSLRF